jgi:hypothetical protein
MLIFPAMGATDAIRRRQTSHGDQLSVTFLLRQCEAVRDVERRLPAR